MHTPVLKFLLLAGVALAPLPAIAQELASDWSPMDDAYGSPEGAAPQDAAPVKKRGRGGDKRQGPRVEVTPYIEA